MSSITTTTNTTTAAAELVNKLAVAWNDADGAAFGEAFTEDADFIDIRGDHHRGRTVIAAGHQAILDTIYSGSTVDYQVEAVRQLSDEVAVAVVAATLDAPTGPLTGTSASRITAVLKLDGGRWSVSAFQNTLRLANPSAPS